MSRGLGPAQRLILVALCDLEEAYGAGVFRMDLLVRRCGSLLAREVEDVARRKRQRPLHQRTILNPGRAIPLLVKRRLVLLDSHGHVGLCEAGRVTARDLREPRYFCMR
jgi:hypothetical protein